MKIQLTLSNALERSTFRDRDFRFLDLIEWRLSLCYPHCLMNFPPFQKSKLLQRDLMRENSFHPPGYYFGDNFVNAITKRN
jgi:hypothetical protein